MSATRTIVISIDGLAGFYWRDPVARMPTLRRLAERGAVAPEMETVFPSTTWPTHASLVTGVLPRAHGVVGNHVLNRATRRTEDLTGDPIYDAADLFRVPTFYDRAHAAGLRTAAIDWPGTRRSPALDFNLPFFKDQAVFETQTAPAVWRELGELGYPIARQGEWSQLPKRFLKDAMVADLAAHVLHRHAPDLLLVHFLCADSLQHLHGPRSPEAYWAIEYIDERIARVLAALPAAELERTNVFVVSDHGFLPVARDIRPNVRLRKLGLLDVDGEGRIARAEARVVMNGGAAYAYISADADRARVAREIAPELAKLPGVAGVWTPDQYAGLGLPADHRQVGDLLLEATEGWAFADDAAGEEEIVPPYHRGTHGHRAIHAGNRAFFAAAGPQIRRGIELPLITTRDVAPTIARTLGLEMGAVEGRALDDILVDC